MPTRPGRSPTRGRPRTRVPLPRLSGPSTRTDTMSASGARAWTIDATRRAVADDVDRARRRRPSASSPSSSTRTLSRSAPPIAGWPPSTPESTTATVTPAPSAVAERPAAIEPPERGEALQAGPVVGGERRAPGRQRAVAGRDRAGHRPDRRPRPRVASLRPPDEDREQLPDEVELAGIGGPEAGDLVGEAHSAPSSSRAEHRDGVGDDRVDVVGGVAGAGLAVAPSAAIAVSADAQQARRVALEPARPDRDGRLAGEHRGELDVAQVERRLSTALVEDLEHADRALVVEERHGDDATAARSRSARRSSGRSARRVATSDSASGWPVENT